MSRSLFKHATTPLMKQYASIKEQYPHALVMFQVGDFYELFFDDAQTAAATLHIALTKRGHVNGEPIPLCGVPLHALNSYLAKLVKAGHQVVIVDQLTEPVPGKVVERGVTQVLTPGTLTDDQLLDEKSASYVLSFFPTERSWGLVFAELLTGQLFATSVPANNVKQLEAELVRFFPDEVLIPENLPSELQRFFKAQGYPLSYAGDTDERQQHGAARAWLARQWSDDKVQQVVGLPSVLGSCAQLYEYLKQNQEIALEHIKSLQLYCGKDYMVLDGSTVRNLELVKNSYDGTRAHTLFSVLDGAITSMGSRMIKKWLLRPLAQLDAIKKRQHVVTVIKDDLNFMKDLEQIFKQIADVERVVGRIALRRGTLRDYRVLATSLALVSEIKKILSAKNSIDLCNQLYAQMGDFSSLVQLLTHAINDDDAYDYIIKQGFDTELDRLRGLVNNSQTQILALEQQEQNKTTISSLKIRYNNVQGYYFEVTKPNIPKVPHYFTRVQTLVNRERFTSPELKALEHDITRARTEISSVEKAVFERVKRSVMQYISPLRHCAYALGTLDALLGLARVAYSKGYVCPEMTTSGEISIEHGRHPVVEAVSNEQTFIPNDTMLNDDQSLWIITGPNMGGKSTYLRQVALISIMAHIGSCVPARAARITLLDKLFTRIGASDQLSQGKSTFLVEMEETAVICQQATPRSLVILDEVGRGTSTFDGVAIAQAVIEYLARHVKSRCLFATHYHELTKLAGEINHIGCYHAASKQSEEGIIFLHKIMPGVADGSFGLEVAKLAHLPEIIIHRAQDILRSLSSHGEQLVIPAQSAADHEQLHRVEAENIKLRHRLQNIDSLNVDELSPRQALEVLWTLKDHN